MRSEFRSRSIPLVLGLCAAVAAFAAVAAVSSAVEPPTITQVSPEVLEPSGPVTIEGSGFAAAPDHVAVLRDETTGEAALIEILSADDTMLHGRLGPTTGEFVGTLAVSIGRWHQLPGLLHAGAGGTYLVEDAEWFVPSAVADAPGPLASPPAQIDDPCFVRKWSAGGFVPGDLGGHSVTLRLPPDPCVKEGINITLVVPGGGSGSDTPGNSIARSTVTLLAAPPVVDHAVLVGDLADVLTDTFAPLGLEVEADGEALVFHWTRDGFLALVTIQPIE